MSNGWDSSLVVLGIGCWQVVSVIARGISGQYAHCADIYYIPCRIEATCYFLSSEDTRNTPQAKEYRQAMDTMVDLIERAQQEDGYLNIYFTVVDPEGRFKNLRDMHEMCECPRPRGE